MLITDILAQTGGLQLMARELGFSEEQAASGAAAPAPTIFAGVKRQGAALATGTEVATSIFGEGSMRLVGAGTADHEGSLCSI